MRIVVVDDDDELCELVSVALVRDGHTVEGVGSVHSATRLLARESFDVVVLDLELPDGSGLELCRSLRREPVSAMRILILTASGDVAARVAGLDAGADDYLVKPFAVAELRARVRALGRRRDEAPLGALVRGDVTLDFGTRRAFRRGLEVALTAKEWAIVAALARGAGKLVPRDVLLVEVWGEANESSNASLGVLMARIRRKLGPDLIRMVRGEGHALG